MFLKPILNRRRQILYKSVNFRISTKFQVRVRKMSALVSSAEGLQKEKELFNSVYPDIIDTLLTRSKFSEQPEVANWVKHVLDYNIAGGKRNRGLSTLIAYKMFDQKNINDEQIKLACILGWCLEMFQSYLIILDDIIDGSKLRRNTTCWYKLPEVGIGAINDAIMIQTSIYEIIKIYFKHKPNYTEVVDLFNEVHLQTIVGQHLDHRISSGRQNKKDYSKFTKEAYETVVRYKSCVYSYELPIRFALYLANITDSVKHNSIQDICLSLGILCQVQDDVIDCFIDETVSGKEGTDIQEGKCTWLAVNALELCNAKQRIVFEACYGSKEPAHIERIKLLYKQLQLLNKYNQHKKMQYNKIVEQAKSLPQPLSPELFVKFADMIYESKLIF